MPTAEPTRSDPPTTCASCGAAGPPTIQVYPDDGRPMIALCTHCARDPERLRALIRTLGRNAVPDEQTGTQ